MKPNSILFRINLGVSFSDSQGKTPYMQLPPNQQVPYLDYRTGDAITEALDVVIKDFGPTNGRVNEKPYLHLSATIQTFTYSRSSAVLVIDRVLETSSDVYFIIRPKKTNESSDTGTGIISEIKTCDRDTF